MKQVALGQDPFCVCVTDLLASHTKVFVVWSENMRPARKFAPKMTFWLSIRHCQLLISSGTPTALTKVHDLPSFVHKDTTQINPLNTKRRLL